MNAWGFSDILAPPISSEIDCPPFIATPGSRYAVVSHNHDNRNDLQDEVDRLRDQVASLTAENETLKADPPPCRFRLSRWDLVALLIALATAGFLGAYYSGGVVPLLQNIESVGVAVGEWVRERLADGGTYPPAAIP